jgi:hypothetical protein
MSMAIGRFVEVPYETNRDEGLAYACTSIPTVRLS